MNSVNNIHFRVHPYTADEYVLLLTKFNHLNGVPLYACGKLDGHIDILLHKLGTMYRWCVVAYNRGLWNIPTAVEQVLDDHAAQTHVKIEA